MSFRLDNKTGKLRVKGVITDIVISSLLAFTVTIILYITEISTNFTLSLSIAHGFSLSCIFIAILVDAYYPFASRVFKTSIIVSVGMALGALLTYLFLINFYGPSANFLNERVYKAAVISLTIGLVATFFFHSRDRTVMIQHKLSEAQLQKANQEKALVEAQLKMLQSQIEPHFLFNTLANIQAMIFHQPDIASQLLTNLTDLLRQSLTKTRQDKIHISDELTFIRSYLSIQKIRLAERLEFSIELSEHLPDDTYLPPLLIQPLVENAVKHGIGPRQEGGEIKVLFSKINDQLCVAIKDNGVGFSISHTKGNGIALNNIRNRINSLFGEKGKLVIRENMSGGVTSELHIPLLTAASSLTPKEYETQQTDHAT
ncbi:sensor histidine kinase [Motilimonas sp. KMU-193]|uniref:sensor histidine kinase n=1 Tax=Motilimonas sp. KMU-193 TaxID=3388668 RepID=UPI00396B0682